MLYKICFIGIMEHFLRSICLFRSSALCFYNIIFDPCSVSVYLIAVRSCCICQNIAAICKVIALADSVIISVDPLPAVVVPGAVILLIPPAIRV